MNSITSTNSTSNSLSSDYSSLLSSAENGSSNFGSIFSQAMTAAKTPAQKAEVNMAEVQYSDLNTLSEMDDSSSDSSDMSSFASLASLIGGNDPFSSSVPSWETDLANLLGPDSDAAKALSAQQQASLALQSMFNGGLGTSGSAIDSLF